MANSKGSSNIRNLMYCGKHAPLPPKCPCPIITPLYTDYIPHNTFGSKAVLKPREGNTHHQRTSSESFLIEEQPSWLDDLLKEPETPVHKGGHRRSSSDSFAYIDARSVSNVDFSVQDNFRYKNMISIPWSCQDFNHYKETQHTSFHAKAKMTILKNRAQDSSLADMKSRGSLPFTKDDIDLQRPGQVRTPQEVDGVPSSAEGEQDVVESGPRDPKVSSEIKDGSNVKPTMSDSDNIRAKQQFAQRSRVRKLQYIAELERNVQGLQAEGSEVSAELDFLNQQNLILSMENKTLKQRLESIAQEQLIKYMEQEVLEREIGRLRAMYQQQPPSSSGHRRSKSRDLDTQFANLSLKHKDAILITEATEMAVALSRIAQARLACGLPEVWYPRFCKV